MNLVYVASEKLKRKRLVLASRLPKNEKLVLFKRSLTLPWFLGFEWDFFAPFIKKAPTWKLRGKSPLTAQNPPTKSKGLFTTP